MLKIKKNVLLSDLRRGDNLPHSRALEGRRMTRKREREREMKRKGNQKESHQKRKADFTAHS